VSANRQSKATQEFVSEAWRLFPHTYAARMSKGRWKPYSHLSYLSRLIGPAIIRGGARYIVTIPPRHGKSELISHWVPTWYLDLFPEKRVILTTYEADFASHWGRQVRNEIQNGDDMNVGIVDDSSAANRWNTTEGGGMITAGVGGPITGRGGDLLLADDLIKNWKEAQSPVVRRNVQDWFRSTFYTRAEPNASIIVLMTRWHEDDPVGWLQANYPGVWTEIRLPAIAEAEDPLGRAEGDALCPERYDVAALTDLKTTLGPHMFTGLFQQAPSPPEGNAIKKSWFKYWTPETLPPMDEVIQSWDLSFDDTENSAFNVGEVWGRAGADCYLLDEVRERLDFPGQIHAIVAMTVKWPQARRKLVEKRANGAAAIKTLKKRVPGLLPIEPVGSKEMRVAAVTPMMQSGNVYLPDKKLFSWVGDRLEEYANFPKGTYKDRVDATSQALAYLETKAAKSSNLGMTIGSMTKSSLMGM